MHAERTTKQQQQQQQQPENMTRKTTKTSLNSIAVEEVNLFTRFGSANMQRVFFRPRKFDSTPKKQLPRMAPILKHAPIQEVSNTVNGPLSNGELFDCNFNKFGLSLFIRSSQSA